jgi:hypothetical protein
MLERRLKKSVPKILRD